MDYKLPFEDILNAAPDAMLVSNEKGEIIFVNQQTKTVFGYSKDELIGKRIEVLIPSRYAGHHHKHVGSFFEKPNFRAMGSGTELFGLRKDGVEIPVEISLSPVQTDRGTLVAASIRDVSDKRRVEKEAEENRNFLSHIVNNSQSLIYAKDLEGKYVLVNDQWCAALKKSKDVIGLTDFDVFDKEQAQQYSTNDKEVLTTKTAVRF